MNDTLTIRLGEKLANALDEESRLTGLSKSEIVRQALTTFLERKRRSTVIGRYFGVIQGPADLSTNKDYRRDWKKRLWKKRS
jgi:metal-responsive CopG/Arc/MetJ family transcriptional regulator